MTVVQLSSGQTIRVSLALDDLQGLVQKAINAGVLLELEGANGETVVINPQQVQILKPAAQDEPVQNGNGTAVTAA